MKHKVLITDRCDEKARVFLESQDELEIRVSQSPHLKSENLDGVECLFIRSRTLVDKALLERAKDLKLVVTATSGFDHIDLVAAQERGVKVAFTPEANAASAAELTWALVLACARNLKLWSQNSKLGHQLAGKTYGVIGCGRIGSRVARIAQAFGMRVLVYDAYVGDIPWERRGLDELLRESDVVSLHVPLTRETRKMINRNTLEGLSSQSILVNTSRGEVIDEVALIDVLREGDIGAVGLDVVEREPLTPDYPLHKFENVILTPHIGARTAEAFEQASLEAAQQIASFFKGSDLAHPLPPKADWYHDPRGF